MPVLASIVAWSADDLRRCCEIFDTEHGCVVQMTLNGLPVIQQRCQSAGEALGVARHWGEPFVRPSVIGPRAA